MVCVLPVHFGGDTEQRVLDVTNGFPRRQAGTVAQSENMGVYGERRLAKGDIEDDIGCFASDAGQGFQGVARCGHLSLMQGQ